MIGLIGLGIGVALASIAVSGVKEEIEKSNRLRQAMDKVQKATINYSEISQKTLKTDISIAEISREMHTAAKELEQAWAEVVEITNN